MAAVVCQGSMSWSDPGFHLVQEPDTRCSTDRSFLEAVLMGDRRIKDDVYVNARVFDPCSLRLSQKSLELCTENLGNETGSDMSDSESVEVRVFSLSMKMTGEQTLKPSQGEATKAKKYAGFPPPLTTMKGRERLRVQPHREQGRLVLEAVKMSPTNRIFQAERSQGSLTLRFLNESAPVLGHNVEEEEQDCRNREDEDKVEGNEDDIGAADRRTMDTIQMSSRCKDSHHRRQLQHENRGLLNLGDVMGGLLLNFRLLFLVAFLSTIC